MLRQFYYRVFIEETLACAFFNIFFDLFPRIVSKTVKKLLKIKWKICLCNKFREKRPQNADLSEILETPLKNIRKHFTYTFNTYIWDFCVHHKFEWFLILKKSNYNLAEIRFSVKFTLHRNTDCMQNISMNWEEMYRNYWNLHW